MSKDVNRKINTLLIYLTYAKIKLIRIRKKVRFIWKNTSQKLPGGQFNSNLVTFFHYDIRAG